MEECQKSLKIKISATGQDEKTTYMLKDSKNQVSSVVACDQTCLCRNAFYSLDLVFLIMSTRKHVSYCCWVRRSHLSGSKGSCTELNSHLLDEQQRKQNTSVLIQGSYPHNEKLNLVTFFTAHDGFMFKFGLIFWHFPNLSFLFFCHMESENSDDLWDLWMGRRWCMSLEPTHTVS